MAALDVFIESYVDPPSLRYGVKSPREPRGDDGSFGDYGLPEQYPVLSIIPSTAFRTVREALPSSSSLAPARSRAPRPLRHPPPFCCHFPVDASPPLKKQIPERQGEVLLLRGWKSLKFGAKSPKV
jgi:hypothetical protein